MVGPAPGVGPAVNPPHGGGPRGTNPQSSGTPAIGTPQGSGGVTGGTHPGGSQELGPPSSGTPAGNTHPGGARAGNAGQDPTPAGSPHSGQAQGGSPDQGGNSTRGGAQLGNLHEGASSPGSSPDQSGPQAVYLNTSGSPPASPHDGPQANPSEPAASPDQVASSHQDPDEAIVANQDGGVSSGNANQASAQAALPGASGLPSQAGVQATSPGQAGNANPIASANPAGALGNRQHARGQGGDDGPGGTPLASQHADESRRQDIPIDTALPAAASVLAELLPVDLTALDRAIEHCLGQINPTGDTVTDLLASDGPWPWLAGAAVASAAGIVVHWWGRRSRFNPVTLVNGEGTLSSFLESMANG